MEVMLSQPNLTVSSYLYFQEGAPPSIHQERPTAPSLREIFSAPRWSGEQLIGALRRLCALLQWSHDAGIIHRSLTPENIYINEQLVVIGNWEHSQPISAVAPPLTPYSAPEIARKALTEIDPRSDLFSLGAILYEWLVGAAPFSGSTPLLMLRSILGARPQPPGALRIECSEALSDLCMQLLEIDKGARPHSAKALSMMLPAEQEQALASTFHAVLDDPREHPVNEADNKRIHALPSQITPNPSASAPDTTGGAAPSNSPRSALPNPTLSKIDGDPYVRLEELGRGGLGLVTKAQDKRLGRVVAVKELLRNKGAARERFLREAFITAKLQHPGVVPIYEAGFWPNGAPFYSMKLIAGKSFEKLIKGTQDLNERLALLPQVLAAAETIAYAHHNQIIHRDLKPHNIVVGEFGETVIIDWGLAKELGTEDIHDTEIDGDAFRDPSQPGLTQTGEVLGTPAYMPVEQAQGKKVDPRADVYALGAILYHLLSGKPPYQGKKSLHVIHELLENPPVSIEEQEPSLPRALLAIVNKAMAREAKERYPSAKELAEDLKKFLSGQLVGAHQYSLWEQLKLKVQQNKTAFLVGLSAAMMLVVGGGVSIRSIIQSEQAATQAKLRAMKNEEVANTKTVIAEKLQAEARKKSLEDTLTAAEALLNTNPTEALDKLKIVARDFPEYKDWGKLRTLAADALYRGTYELLKASPEKPFTNAILWSAYSPDGKYAAASSYESTKLWSSDGALLKEFEGYNATFSPDSALLAFVTKDFNIQLYSLREEKIVSVLKGHTQKINEFVPIAFSPDGKSLASYGEDQQLFLWDLATGANQSIAKIEALSSFSFSPDSRSIAIVNMHEVRLASLDGVRVIEQDQSSYLSKALFSPDGEQLAVSANGDIQLWSLKTNKIVAVLPGNNEALQTLFFHPTGKYLLGGMANGVAMLWDLSDCKAGTCQSRALSGHQGTIMSAAFSPDGDTFATSSLDQTIRIWSLSATRERQVLRGHTRETLAVSFSPDGKKLISSGADSSVRRWSLAEESYTVDGNVAWMSASPDGRWLALTYEDGSVELRNLIQGTTERRTGHNGQATAVAFAPDSQRFATTSRTGEVLLWSTLAKEPISYTGGPTGNIFDIRFSPDGKRVGVVSRDKTLAIWDLAAKNILFKKEIDGVSLDFSPKGDQVVVLQQNASLQFFGADGSEQFEAERPEVASSTVRFSPDGKTVAISNMNASVELWSTSTPKRLEIFNGHRGNVFDAEFSTDGRLVSASADGTIRIWDLASGANRTLTTSGTAAIAACFFGDGYVAFVDVHQLFIAPDNLPHGEAINAWLNQP